MTLGAVSGDRVRCGSQLTVGVQGRCRLAQPGSAQPYQLFPLSWTPIRVEDGMRSGAMPEGPGRQLGPR